MSHIVIDTNTFSFKNITNIVNNNFPNDAFKILCDIIHSNQIRGMHYSHSNNLGEAQKAAYIDGYDIHNCFFMSEN